MTTAVLATDLASKELVKQSATVRRWDFIHLVDNPSWTLGAGGGSGLMIPLLSALVLAASIWWLHSRLLSGLVRPWPAALIIGGGAGNLIDRLIHGAVTDFLVTPWLIVNLADLAVLTGLIAFACTGGYRQLLLTGSSSRPARPGN